jgi:hypothetical protein
MQNEFYKAGYNDALVKMGGFGSAIASGLSSAGKWLGNIGTKVKGQAPGMVQQLNASKSAPLNWIGGKMQGISQGLGNTFTNMAAAPGQTLWQGAGNFGKNMLGMGQANTTSGVLGRGAMGVGLVGGATGGFGNRSQPRPGQLPGPGQIQ